MRGVQSRRRAPCGGAGLRVRWNGFRFELILGNREGALMAIEDDSPAATASTSVNTLLRKIASAPSRATPENDFIAAIRPVEDLIGDVLDTKYRVESLLGQGGMGAVYLATHLGTGRAVALKVLVPGLTANEEAVERFRREAQAAGRVRHPNVVNVTDFGFAVTRDNRRAYLVMEHLRGQTLRARLDASGPLPVDVAIEVLHQVCAGVAEAHALGILHRDLKPENIHLEPSARGHYRVKVLDFGIAKLMGPSPVSGPLPNAPQARPSDVDASLAATLPALASNTPSTPALGSGERAMTEVGTVIGTPRYMAPEQWMGGSVNVRADVYSLGVLAYEMLTGEPPFLGKGRSIAMEHRLHPPPPLIERAPSVPRGIVRVIESALAKDPAARPQSVSALAAVLHAGTETTGKLLRRSIALCLEHYWLFFRPMLILTVPVLLVTLASVLSLLLAHRGFVSSRADAWLGVGLAQASTFVAFPMSVALMGLVVPLTADLNAAGRPLRPPPSIAEFWRILRGSLPSSLVKMAIMFVVPPLVLLPIVKLGHLNLHGLRTFLALIFVQEGVCYLTITPFILAGPIVAVERLRGLAPLKRSANLVWPILRTAIGVALLRHLLAFGIQISFNLASAAITNTPLQDALAGDRIAFMTSTVVRVSGVLAALVSMALFPFFLPLEALLYLRAREAEGDPVTI